MRLPCVWAVLLLVLLPTTMHAVVVRGVVRDPLGRPVSGARVVLAHGTQAAGVDVAGPDGEFEIRSSAAGRFVLVTTAAPFAPQISRPFYGGRTAVMWRVIRVDRSSIEETESHAESGLATSPEQVTGSASRVAGDDVRTQVGLASVMGSQPGLLIFEQGQVGGEDELLVRGAPAAGTVVEMDGHRLSAPGREFRFAEFATTGLADSEIGVGADSALYGAGGQAGVVRLESSRGSAARPMFDYAGDGGNLHSWRDEATVSGAWRRLDYLAGYSRFDTSNALLLDRYHAATAVANVGYSVLTNTTVRVTLRDSVTAAGTPGPHDIFGLSADGRRGEQALYGGAVLENRFRRLHGVLAYGLVRDREQVFDYAPQGQMAMLAGATVYLGNPVVLRGGNGFSAMGRAQVDYAGSYPARQDDVSNRDEFSVGLDYDFGRYFALLAGVQVEQERGEFVSTATGRAAPMQRTNVEATVQMQGSIASRVFYSAGGLVEQNELLGWQGSPRVGVRYVALRPGTHWMQGTSVHVSAATGFGEPSFRDEATAISTVLQQAGQSGLAAHYGPTSAIGARSRTFEAGVDQHVFRQRLVAAVTYFHGQFSHQQEWIDPGTMEMFFGLARVPLSPGAVDSSLAYRAAGAEAEVRYQPKQRLLIRGSYMYLASVVEQAFDRGGVTNANLPDALIGPSYPLLGARPFHRPAQSGGFLLQYTGTKWTFALTDAVASRSDDTTHQTMNDAAGGNSLLLPNRDLDFGYARLGMGLTRQMKHHATAYVQMDNLLNEQHTGAIGYPGVPLTIRAGLRFKLGGD